MHPQTGEIFDKEEIREKIRELEKQLEETESADPFLQGQVAELKKKLKDVEKMVDIPPKDFMKVVNMNRKQRRAWAAKQRKKVKRSSKQT
jgi:chromosome segregation ATPase